MRDIDITTLRLFVAVCELRSMSRVSEDANMVPSAISKRLAALEEALGVPLLIRRRRGVEPTAAGETLLEHARAILAGADQIHRDMSAYAAGVKGLIKVLASSSAMAESLADDIAGFLHIPAHHDIRVSLEEAVSEKVVQGVRAGVASLGICWDAADFQGLEHVPYRHDHLAVLVPEGHPLAGRKTVAFEEVLDYEQVSLPPTTAVVSYMRRQAALLGRTFSHRVTVSNFDSALRVVQARLGVSIAPREVLAARHSASGIVAVDLSDSWAKRRFAVCFQSRASLTPAARLLMEYLGSDPVRGLTPGAAPGAGPTGKQSR
ncbi:LysR family transcriptional regulator [Parapusillimonas sp. JC17]|uniref:LysR family transcriptional regulator n=1 Tax=Parapusillimonas sp. JC17 TaxID=3445768 RepID=UPI003FA13005